jgi:hypothetical protein
MDLETQKESERAFLALAERFRAATDPHEVKQLGDEIGWFIFGEQIQRPERNGL